MSIFGARYGAGPPEPKSVKPHKVSLYETRDLISPAVNLTRLSEINPAAEAAGNAATMAANEAGRPASPLFGMLENQAAADLALGGELGADEIRAAQQAGLANWSSRGLVRSPQAGFAAVLSRLQYANQRKADRRGFASGVVGLDNQRRSTFADIAQSAGTLRSGAYGMAEQMRQDELSRLDSLKLNDKTAAVNLKTGQANAAAGASAARSAATGQAVGAVAGIAVAAIF